MSITIRTVINGHVRIITLEQLNAKTSYKAKKTKDKIRRMRHTSSGYRRDMRIQAQWQAFKSMRASTRWENQFEIVQK